MRYYRFYITLLLLSTGAITCNGQCPSNKGQLEIAVSQGFITSDQLSDQIHANDNAAANSGGKSETYNSGATFVTVRYFLFNRLALGLAGGISNVRGQSTDQYNSSVIVSTYKESVTTVAVELYYIYFFRKRLEVYTLCGVGPAFTTTTTNINPTSFASEVTNTVAKDNLKLQYTPIGVRIGGRIGGFVELGIGYKGIINAGLSFKFGPSCWWKAS